MRLLFFPFVLIGVALIGCARPTGDFGRPQPSVIHDTLLPSLGKASLRAREEPASFYNLTDHEKILRDRGWRLIVPPHAHDWYGANVAEWQRVGLTPRADMTLKPERYAQYLSSQAFRSSETRYRRIADDAQKDMLSLPDFFAVVDRVARDDTARLEAARAIPDLQPSELKNIYDRISENQFYVAWVKRSLYFRLYAYRYALDRLLIETPSPQAAQVKLTLDQLDSEIARFVYSGVYPVGAPVNPAAPYAIRPL
jgi:hypothetical protein